MSDPTIQTFCCHHTGSKEDLAVRIMDEFNTESYNAVCLVSSTVGILGSMYQIYPCSYDQERFPNVTNTRGRHIIIWLAVADLLASLGKVFLSAPLYGLGTKVLCLCLMMKQVFYFAVLALLGLSTFFTATWFWTLFYAIDTLRTIKGRDSYPVLYHSIAWGVPAATTGIGLSILYIPNAKCHNLKTVTSAFFRILPNYCATYFPIAMVMIVNPVLYILASKEVEVTVALPLAQFTSKERRVVDALKLKFFLINAVFYICWLPNLINGVMIWTMWFNMPVKIIISIWYIMALMNPMQALLNAFVYRRWNPNGKRSRPTFSSIHKELNLRDEQSPLLGSEPPRLQLSHLPSNVNNYATL